MKRSKISQFADSSSVSQWLERLSEFLFLIPLSVLAGDALFAFVPAVVLYRILLDFACVYLPFALAGLIRPLLRKHRTRRIMSVHRTAMKEMLVSGLILTLTVLLAAGPLSSFLLGGGAPEEHTVLMQTAIRCFAPLITAEFLLSVFRGTDLGMMRGKPFLVSVIAEQLLRCLLILAAVLVPQTAGAEASVRVILSGAACLAAAGAVLGVYVYRSGGLIQGVPSDADAQTGVRLHRKVFASLFSAAADHLWLLFDLAAAVPLSLCCGMDYSAAESAYGIIMVQCMTLVLLPLLATFHIASDTLAPLENALALGDGDRIEKLVTAAFCRSLKVIVPVGVFIALHADAVAHALFGIQDVQAAVPYFAVSGVFAVVYGASVFSSQIMDALHLRGRRTAYCFLALAFKAAAVWPLMQRFQMTGLLLSSVLYFAVVLFMNLARIKNRTFVEYRRVGSTLLRILGACCAMHGAVYGLSLAGISAAQSDPLTAGWNFALMAVCGGAVYYMTGDILRIFRFRRGS